MKVPVCIIKRFAYNESTKGYYKTFSYITDFTSVSISYGYKDKKDTFSISLIPKKKFNSLTQEDIYSSPPVINNDLLKFYVYYEDDSKIILDTDGVTITNLDDFLFFEGIVSKFNYSSNQGIYSLQITGNNRTEILLNNMVFFQYSNVTVPDMICLNASKFRAMNKNKPLFMFKDYKGDGTDSTTDVPLAWGASVESNYILYTNYYNNYINGYESWGLVPRGGIRAYKQAAYVYDAVNGFWRLKEGIDLNAKNSDGEYIYRFAKTDYFETYKSLYSHLDVLSGVSKTGDANAGSYITHINKYNVMIWEPKSVEVDNDLSESETSSTTVNREIRDVVNAVIINAGNDVKGRGILALAYNTSSMSKYGAKWKYIVKTNFSEQIMNKQKEDSGDEYNDDNNFPKTYPVYVTSPKSSSILDNVTFDPEWNYNIGDALNSNYQYNTYIRRVARENAKEFGRDFTANNSDPKFSLRMKLDVGSNDFYTGEFIEVDVPSVNWDDLKKVNLRIEEIKHTIDSNGWSTELSLEQDIKQGVITND